MLRVDAKGGGSMDAKGRADEEWMRSLWMLRVDVDGVEVDAKGSSAIDAKGGGRCDRPRSGGGRCMLRG